MFIHREMFIHLIDKAIQFCLAFKNIDWKVPCMVDLKFVTIESTNIQRCFTTPAGPGQAVIKDLIHRARRVICAGISWITSSSIFAFYVLSNILLRCIIYKLFGQEV